MSKDGGTRTELGLSFVKEWILDDYRLWFDRGQKTGKWIQDRFFLLVGDAGIGKTAIMYQISELLEDAGYQNPQVHELYLPAFLDPTDAGGMRAPDPKCESVELSDLAGGKYSVNITRMHFNDGIVQAKAKGPGTILFIDELGREAAMMDPLLYKVLHRQKSLAGLDIRDMYVVLAMNPPEGGYNVNDVLSETAFRDRVCPVYVRPAVQEVADYFYNLTPTHREFANALLDQPHLLLGRDGDSVDAAWRSPRSYDTAASTVHDYGGGTATSPGKISGKRVLYFLSQSIGPTTTAIMAQYFEATRPMSIRKVLTGDFKLDAKGRVAPPLSLVRSLQYYLETTELLSVEVPNLAKFLDGMNLDQAGSLVRRESNLLPENREKLFAEAALVKFYQRRRNPANRAKSQAVA